MLTLINQNQSISPLTATQPWSGVSENYRFVSTQRIIELAERSGFEVHKTTIARVKRQDKAGFQKHRVDLVHKDFKDVGLLGDSIPRLTLCNSHDRSQAVVLSLGYYRLVCSNGLLVGDAFGGTALKVYHSGSKDLEKTILERIAASLELFPKLIESQQEMRATQLDIVQQAYLANEVSQYLIKEKKCADVLPGQLLNARRAEDTSQDLWTTVNRIQENVIKGNYSFRSNTTGQLRKSTSIKSIDADIKFNKFLMDQASLLLNTRKAA